MATFWERVAHSVNRTYSLLCLFDSHFGFEGGTLVLIASVPAHCLPLIFYFRYIDSTIPLLHRCSCHLLWLYSPVCVGPGRKHRIQ